jgi:cytochrome c-type biogenesis protein CcmH
VSTTFWIVAGALCLTAVGILLFPVWQRRRLDGRWSPAGLVAAFVVAPLALGMYALVGNQEAARFADQIAVADEALAELQARLERDPGNVEGWGLLARSYFEFERYGQSRAAYERLWALTPEPDVDLKLAYAEVQILAEQNALAGDSVRLVEEVLAARPQDPKALWYGGLAAFELGRPEVARQRFTTLLAFNPPPEVVNVIRDRLAALGGPEGGQGSAPVEGPAIKLSVTLGAGRSIADLGPSAQLFIIARAPEGGPPIAVIRRPPSTVPGEFTLSDADSMIAGRSLASYPEIAVVARLSRTGQPIEQPGDWFAETSVRLGEPGTVALVIDEVVQ